jgi:hypothetical protein
VGGFLPRPSDAYGGIEKNTWVSWSLEGSLKFRRWVEIIDMSVEEVLSDL